MLKVLISTDNAEYATPPTPILIIRSRVEAILRDTGPGGIVHEHRSTLIHIQLSFFTESI